MEKVDKLTVLLFTLVIIFVAGYTGISWLMGLGIIAALGFFLFDFHPNSNRIVDMVNIIVFVAAIAAGFFFGRF